MATDKIRQNQNGIVQPLLTGKYLFPQEMPIHYYITVIFFFQSKITQKISLSKLFENCNGIYPEK